MKNLKLLELRLKNFKGIREFELTADGHHVKVYGDNATGKTTLFDAFVWLLFDKDSNNRKDFQIKTVNERGEELHGLEHEVEGVFLLNDQKLSLRKVYKEKWTKKRGSAEKQFTGHTTDYYIDGVPAKKKEFTEKVDEVVDEEIFKLLTSPTYFNEQLHWQKRREILLEICGDISDEEVIAHDEKLSKLPDILSGRSIEDHRKVIASRRSEINKELERIPVRIDEVQRSLPDIDELDEKSITKQIKQLKDQINEKEKEISRIQSGGEISNKEKQLRELEAELLDIKNKHQSENYDKVNEKRRILYDLQERIDKAKHKISQKQRTIQSNEQEIEQKEQRIKELREKWHEVNQEEFHDDVETSCPTCGQDLPEDQVQDAKEKAEAGFNIKKSERLEEITQQGKTLREQVEYLNAENIGLHEEIMKAESALKGREETLERVQAEINDLKENTTSIEENPAYQEKMKQINEVKQQIENMQTSINESINSVREEIRILQQQVDEMEQKKAKIEQYKLSQNRIAELEQQEKELAAEYERLEEELYLTEEFIRTKVNLLEEKINNKFNMARFKLFEQQINGGLQEICETTYKGVPYSTLNNAARINIGLDIINTLSEHYGFSAPIFIDNSEAVTKLIEVNAQVISLVVSESDKVLRVDMGQNLEREAV